MLLDTALSVQAKDQSTFKTSLDYYISSKMYLTELILPYLLQLGTVWLDCCHALYKICLLNSVNWGCAVFLCNGVCANNGALNMKHNISEKGV